MKWSMLFSRFYFDGSRSGDRVIGPSGNRKKPSPGFFPCLCVSVVGLILLISCLPASAQTAAPQLTADASHSPGWVVIPVDEYRNLRARAFPAERDPEPPPVDATLTRVDYDLRIAGELAT